MTRVKYAIFLLLLFIYLSSNAQRTARQGVILFSPNIDYKGKNGELWVVFDTELSDFFSYVKVSTIFAKKKDSMIYYPQNEDYFIGDDKVVFFGTMIGEVKDYWDKKGDTLGLRLQVKSKINRLEINRDIKIPREDFLQKNETLVDMFGLITQPLEAEVADDRKRDFQPTQTERSNSEGGF